MKTTLVLSSLFIATIATADATVEQKAQVHFGGFMGGVINVFGGSRTHEGMNSTTYVHGNRRATITGGSEEIVDLAGEKIYRLDLDRKTYTVVTFDELRKQFEEQKQRAGRGASQRAEKPEGPEYEVDISVDTPGKKETINGYETHEVITKISVHEKGKKIDESGGVVMSADTWIGPRVAAMRELADFDRRYYQKLYGSLFSAADTQQMAVLFATNPAFAKAMKAFADKRASFDGTPIRTTLTVEAVAGAEQKTSDQPSGLGGLLRKARRQDDASANRSELMTSTTELIKASTSATASEVEIPADFKQR
jgi:hypothetical protein